MISVLRLEAADDAVPASAAGKTNGPAAVEKDESKKEEGKKAVAAIPDAAHKPVLITNTVTVAGHAVTYVAQTAMLPLLKPDGTVRASVFYVAYTKQGENQRGDATGGPFVSTGGRALPPCGCTSEPLGPRRVRMNEDGTLPKPPFSLMDNEYSLLGATDLVFIDPVATGFSRPAKDEKADQFFGQSGDIESVGDFIRLWATRHQRWLVAQISVRRELRGVSGGWAGGSPRSRYGMYLNGLILVSGCWTLRRSTKDVENELGALAFLPAYTATAHFQPQAARPTCSRT